MMNIGQLDKLSKYILLLPRPAQLRVLDDMNEVIKDRGFITVGEFKQLIKDELI